jgi:hypothetical protein
MRQSGTNRAGLPAAELPCFADCYCQRHGIFREAFMLAVLHRTLHPHVRPFFSLILEFRPQYFAPDFDFVVTVGRVRHYRDYESAVSEFAAHPANQGLLRRWLRLRVSARRMRRLVHEIYVRTSFVLPEADDSGSLSPFPPARHDTVTGILGPARGH